MSEFLADTSVLHRVRRMEQDLSHIVAAGGLATCAIVDLEMGYSALRRADHDVLLATRLAMPRAPVDEPVLRRAMEVQNLLAGRGWHRMPVTDVIIAAAAEQAGMTVLHYDSDFERIAEVTGQPHRWIAPRGSL